jgi:pyrimidine operon attenuation protein/uracil phosphoribosyltransferase
MTRLDLSIDSLISTIGDNIIAAHDDLESIILVGIMRGGVPVAERLQKYIQTKTKTLVSLGKLDITLYRDDLTLGDTAREIQATWLPDSIDNQCIILVDEVIFRGRTVRAAIDHILDYGRPQKVELAVLIDRGHRELPFSANYIGHILKTQSRDTITVHFKESDGEDAIDHAQGT